MFITKCGGLLFLHLELLHQAIRGEEDWDLSAYRALYLTVPYRKRCIVKKWVDMDLVTDRAPGCTRAS